MDSREKGSRRRGRRANLVEAELARFRDKVGDLLRAKDAMNDAVLETSYREAKLEYDVALDALRALVGTVRNG